MRKILFISFIIILFSGCQYEKSELKSLNHIDTKEKKTKLKEQNKTVQVMAIKKENNEQKYKLQQLEANSKLELAKLNAQKEQNIKEIEYKRSIEEAKINRDIAIEKQKNNTIIEEKRLNFLTVGLIVVAVIALLILFVIVFINKKNRETKLKMQKEEIKKEKELQKNEHYNQRINKMLDIVSSKEINENVENQLLSVLKDITKKGSETVLIENKNDTTT